MRTSPLRASLGSLVLAASLLASGTDVAPAAASAHLAPHIAARVDMSRGAAARRGTEPGLDRVGPAGRSGLGRAQLVRAAAPSSGDQVTSARDARTGWAPFTIPIGNSPQGVAVDAATHTAYAANGDDATVSVIDTATCDAHVTTRCADTPPVINLGDANAFPVQVVRVAATHTLYTTNAGDGTVSVINTATCNSLVATSCGRTPPRITVGNQPVDAAYDPATHTLYVANFSDGTVSMIDTATCNARVSSGCGQKPTRISFGAVQPSGVFLDASTGTLYVANLAAGPNESEPDALSIVNTATCNAQVSTGCTGPFTSVPVGTGSSEQNVAFALDQPRHTLYVANYTANTISLVNTAHCTASDNRGCAQPAKAVPAVGGGTDGFVLNPTTHTLYEVQNADNTTAVVAVATCNVHHDGACARPVGLLRGGAGSSFAALDPATGSLYVTNTDAGDVSVMNAATCNADTRAGCTSIPPAAPVGNNPVDLAIDAATHTAYVANNSDNTVSVINIHRCNALHPAGCVTNPPTIKTGSEPWAVAVDPASDTVYVTNIGDNTVSVLNGATCNALTHGGCHQTPVTINVEQEPSVVTVDPDTHTAYVANKHSGDVSVINTETCRAGHPAGCSHTPPTVGVGSGPGGVLINDTTHTAYVNNQGDNTISVINTRTCNATDTGGCAAAPPTVSAGDCPYGMALDPVSNTLYVGNCTARAVAMLNTSTCRADHTAGCDQTPTMTAVGSFPASLAIDPANRTVYVGNFSDNSVSLINTITCNHLACPQRDREAPSLVVGDGPDDIVVGNDNTTVYVVTGEEAGLDNDVSMFRT